MIYIIGTLIGFTIAVLLLFTYAICVVSSKADGAAELQWKNFERNDS